MDLTQERLDGIKALLGPEASDDDARAVDPFLQRDYPGLEPKDLPAEAFAWLCDGAPQGPPIEVLLGLYNDMSESRRADLVECARVLAIA